MTADSSKTRSTHLRDMPSGDRHRQPFRAGADWPFFVTSGVLGGGYVVLLLALLAADVASTSRADLAAALTKPEILFAVRMTLVSCTLAALLSLWVAVPLGYLLERFTFRGRGVVDAVLDIPVVLPPLVLGLSLLILFHLPLGGTTLEALVQRWLGVPVTYGPVAVVLAQFVVAAAFAIHSMRLTFARIDPRPEAIAMTLGCRRSQAFWRVAFPQAWRGMIAAFSIAWARSLGEFGPILVFAGATRMKTEVLSTTVFLELSVGRLEAAVAVSLLMVVASVIVLSVVRIVGGRVAG
jgi:molybdate transport system permease protein